ncbi:nucleotidyltransferase domain-containing protein [Geoglobus acetivorans]|uniref:Nucleotidyltransferase domain-containing protein n=1 Tax=Geoglobus acetivorans TaxID=565033 RepID=A0ABZ3H3R9_GEOAI|nr:nucleotidyltransferase domain-containing protein [Geoglobus acetivorans]
MNFDARIENAKEESKYFENWMHYARLISRIATEILGDARVYVFGSVVDGRHTLASDIDVLIVSSNTPERLEGRAKITGKITRKIGVFSPFEFRIVTPKEFKWYQRFVKRLVEIR